jgi:hypothetical protein
VSTAIAWPKKLLNSSKNRKQMTTMKLEVRTCGLEARPSDAMTIKNVPVLKQENPGTI